MKNILYIIIILSALYLLFGSDTPSASTIEEGKERIIGTWTATPTGSTWTKINFKENGTYDLWIALPNSGSWGSIEMSGTYEILKSRYSDTGKEYVYAQLNDSGLCDYRLVMTGNASLVCGSTNFQVIEKTDKNPW
jgi:hypothetical protein